MVDSRGQSPGRAGRRETFLLPEEAQKALESAIEAAEQLAIYYEHRAKQPRRALDLMQAAIAELESAQRDARIAEERARKIKARLACRLARLERRSRGTPNSRLAARKSPIKRLAFPGEVIG